MTDLRPRRLLLSADALDLLRRRVLAPPLSLPPGFALDSAAPSGQVPEGVELSDGSMHPSVVGDLELLARPGVAVTVRAARPGLSVTACVAVAGVRGAGLLRTGDTSVQLSCFPAADLARELSRVVPAATAPRRERPPEQVPLDVLLDGRDSPLRGHVGGTLHACVAGPAGLLGSVEWVWDGAGWIGLEPLWFSDLQDDLRRRYGPRPVPDR